MNCIKYFFGKSIRFRLTVVILFLFAYSYSQKPHVAFALKEGCYVKGTSPATNEGLFYFFKRDYSFISIYVYQNKIKMVRMGMWDYLGDSMLRFRYLDFKSAILINARIEYAAETKEAMDSVYFKGTVRDTDGSPQAFGMLILDNERNDFRRFGVATGYGLHGLSTDSKGEFSFSIPQSQYHGSIGVMITPAYYPVSITTSPNQNYHTLVITVPARDSTNDVDYCRFDSRPEVFKYRIAGSKVRFKVKSNELPLTYISKDPEILLRILHKAKKQQPNLIGIIEELTAFLRDK